MSQYTTIEGDMVDMICRRIFGDESGFTEQVYAFNPGLSALGPVLPAGVVIDVPDLDLSSTLPSISLWD